jgi:hypothetical protein
MRKGSHPETFPLRKGCSGARQSRSEASLKFLQAMDHIRSEYRKNTEDLQYSDALKNASLLECHLKGQFSLVLDLPKFLEVEAIRRFALYKHGATRNYIPVLIFNSDVFDAGMTDELEQEDVLIRDVEIVQSPKKIIPSIVRLEFVDHEVKQGGRLAVYFHPFGEKTLKVLPRMTNGKFRVTGNGSRRLCRDSVEPSIINGHTKVMDSISSNQSQISDDIFVIRNRVLQFLNSGARIIFDSASVGFRRVGHSKFGTASCRADAFRACDQCKGGGAQELFIFQTLLGPPASAGQRLPGAVIFYSEETR